MTGYIERLIKDKEFGFIRAGKKDFFFHRDSFEGHWDDLVLDFFNSRNKNRANIEVEFEPTDNPKGPRAENVKRLDYPNQAV